MAEYIASNIQAVNLFAPPARTAARPQQQAAPVGTKHAKLRD